MENLTVLDSLEQWPVSIALASFSFDRLERQKILKMSPKDLVRQLPLAITPNGTLFMPPTTPRAQNLVCNWGSTRSTSVVVR